LVAVAAGHKAIVVDEENAASASQVLEEVDERVAGHD
jgi:hypothetical protein